MRDPKTNHNIQWKEGKKEEGNKRMHKRDREEERRMMEDIDRKISMLISNVEMQFSYLSSKLDFVLTQLIQEQRKDRGDGEFGSDSSSGRRKITTSPLPFTGPSSYFSTILEKEPSQPVSVAFTPNRDLVICDSKTKKVQVFDEHGEHLFQLDPRGVSQLMNPWGVVVDHRGHFIVSDSSSHQIKEFDRRGRFIKSFGGCGSGLGQLNRPRGIAVDREGFLFVCDSKNHRVQVIDQSEHLINSFQTDPSISAFNPCGIGMDQRGDLIAVSDSDSHCVHLFDCHGSHLRTFGSRGSSEGQFNFPVGIAVDSEKRIIVCDSNNHRVQVFDQHGAFLASFGSIGRGSGQFNFPHSISIDPASRVAICESHNQRIQLFDH